MNKDQLLPHDILHRLRLLDILDRITQASLASENMEDVLSGVLDLVLKVFNADRAWFLYPCDPEAPSWCVPMERTHPEWPGLSALGKEIPTSPDAAEIFRELLSTNGTIQDGPHAGHPVPQFAVEQFSVKSQLQIALRPKIGKAWIFGLHHCGSEVMHDAEDLHLFAVIAHRISDTLSALISMKQLRESERRSQGMADLVIDNAGVLVVVLDKNGRIVRFNRASEKLSGCTFAEVEGKYLWEVMLPPEEADSVRQDAFEALKRNPQTREGRHTNCWLSKGGERRLIEWVNTLLLDSAGNMEFMVSIGADITERKRVEHELSIAAVSFESQESLMITDADGVILRVNRAFTGATGYAAEEAVGQTPRLLKSGRHDADFYRAMWKTLQRTGTWQGEIWNRCKNGEVHPNWLTISAVKGGGAITHYVGTQIDITDRKAAEEEINLLAFYDPLTRLPNRRLLFDRLRQALASSARSGLKGALLFVDLDNFKLLNDTLGHDIGDLLLQQVAQRLTSCVREGDTVARLGGDEFVMLLEELSEHVLDAAAQTEAVGEKILATLSQPYQLGSHECRSSSSIGTALFGGHERGVDELFKQADIAMYQAKKAGRNTLRFFDPRMQDTINARAVLETELRKALEGDQFHLYYQIQEDSSRRPLGAEALIRWMHPERGLVLPAQFIALAEETGLILPIGQWVLETACAQIKAWQQDVLTRSLVLAVNVSAGQFHQTDFAAQVQAAVQRQGITPGLLKLELTESMLLENIEDTIATMNALKEIGVRISLDDFGSGYSSLQYLKRLTLDQIKIDQSFVRDIAVDSSDKAVVRAIIAMAQSLELDVIAEGVETEEQRQLLLDKGCTRYQGYLFGKAAPVELFEKLLKQS